MGFEPKSCLIACSDLEKRLNVLEMALLCAEINSRFEYAKKILVKYEVLRRKMRFTINIYST